MCGIAGAIRRLLDGREAASRPRSERIAGFVKRISEAQRHRGPDGSGLWQSSGQEVVLGHRRLAILDLSEAGAQPMVDGDTGCVITFNGEIYNFPEIRRDLEALGETFRSSCDTEVVLKAHKRWGIDTVKRFRGIFALALWDPRCRAVHLVRDQMGIKPLYWTIFRDGDTGEEIVLFASEVRALLASGAVPRRLDPAAVASYLWNGFVVGPQTIVEGVHLLPAATILTIKADDLTGRQNSRKMRQYWRMPSSADRKTTVGDLRDELMNTVKMQLVADVPLGVFLSGGIDSAGLAALAAAGLSQPLTTLSVAFEDRALSEAAYARLMASRVGADHHEVLLRAPAVFAELGSFFGAMDQPTVDGLNTWCIARAAREAGLTVVLSGLGGDEVFWGYNHLRRTTALGFARATMAALPAAARRGVSRLGRLAGAVLSRPGLDRLAALETPTAHGAYHLVRGLFPRAAVKDLLGAADGDLEGAPPARSAEACGGGGDLREALTRLEFTHYLADQLLRDTDVMGMAHSIEARVPYLDHRLVERVLALPAALKLDRSRPKPLLLDALGGRLPREIWDRPKMGFTFPMAAWMRERAGDLERLCLEDKWLQRPAVEAVWRAFTAGRSHWSRPWALLVLARFGTDRRQRLFA